MNTQQIKKHFLLTAFSLIFGYFSISQAISADLIAPQIPIDKVSAEIKAKFQDPAFTRDFNQATNYVKKAIDPYVAFNRVSALVLGRLWRKATKDEKLRFKQEFQILLIRTYSRAFFEFKDWSVRFLPIGKLEQGAKKTIVKTEILQPGLQPLAINYRMVLTKSGWKAYDIMIEGISLVTNYRASIKNEYKKTGSLDAVIERLSKRNVAALSKENKS